VCFCQNDINTTGTEQSKVAFYRGFVPVFDISHNGSGSGDWLSGLVVKFCTKGDGDFLTNFTFAGSGCFRVIDAAVQNRGLEQVGAAVFHQQTQETSAVRGRTSGRVVSGVGEIYWSFMTFLNCFKCNEIEEHTS